MMMNLLSECTQRQLEDLTALIAGIRRDWQTPGIKAALIRIGEQKPDATLADTAAAALRAAGDNGARNPAAMTFEAYWTRPAPTQAQRLEQAELCEICMQPEHMHAAIAYRDHEYMKPGTYQPMTPQETA